MIGAFSSSLSRSRFGSWLLLGLSAGVVAGGVAALLGRGQAAAWLWGVTVVAGMVPIAIELGASLRSRRLGVDIVALLAMLGCLALGQLLTGAVIAVMLASGRALETYAQARAQRELTALLQRSPRQAHRVGPDGLETVAVEDLRAGDILLVKPGEVVPVDGLVSGEPAILDESALTGEARPVTRGDGDPVRSGVVNAGGPFGLHGTAGAEQSTYAGILRLVRSAQLSRAPFLRLADRYALAFVPFTLLISAAAGVISGDAVRALAVLVVATPCPLILAAPVAIVAGMSRASKRGVVIKDGTALEGLARARVLLLDKTGTLTAGAPSVREVEVAEGWQGDDVLAVAAALDQVSTHPLAAALVQAARRRGLPLTDPAGTAESPGDGIAGSVAGRSVCVGRLEWVLADAAPPAWACGLRRRTGAEGRAAVFVVVDSRLAGAIILEDRLRPESARTIRSLRRAGIERVVMVSGDHGSVAETVASALGIDLVLADRSPEEKVEAVLAERGNGAVIMVGDGINDAPALAVADVGVAMGARGSTATSETADVVLLVDRLERLAEVLQIARRSRGIALQSVLVGMALSVAAMLLAAAGWVPPLAGAVLQEGIDVAVILNALRAHGGGRGEAGRVNAGASALSRELQDEHVALWAGVEAVRATADGLDRLTPRCALAELRRTHTFLTTRLLPHEFREEADFYPVVASRIGGDDPTATMIRTHVEIAHLTRLLGRAVDDLDGTGPGAADLPELRRVLYGLHAILRLHFAQEEEAYLSLMDERDGSGGPGPALVPAPSVTFGRGPEVTSGRRSSG